MRKYLYYTLFVLTLLFDAFFIYTIISGYNNLEEKTAWVQEAFVSRNAKSVLEILPVYDPKFLKFPPNEPYYSSDGFNKWKEYEKFMDSLRKNTKELRYYIGYGRKIAPVFGVQIFFYTFENKYSITDHSIKMIGNYYFDESSKPSKVTLFFGTAKDYIFSFLGLIFILFFACVYKLLEDMPNLLVLYYTMRIGFMLFAFFFA